ncbi:tyrosine-type recombinase/integrase [Halomicrococcus sp. NG-SE-24]|uniref:tyrosine-type recombinase/integrase n=1 Tax=Halomicrococcus sp. NG-SE-24 TaxID=3436928 RepID=UPI003D97575A
MNLEPIHPDRAVELYLADRAADVSEATLYSHRSRLGHFRRWCDDQDIENLNDLTGRRLHAYRIWRRNDGELAKPTEKTQMDTLRVFIRWLESIDAVEQDLHTKVLSPSLTADENTRDTTLTSDEAEDVLEELEKYQYASLKHVTLALLWHTMMRRGAARALDVQDFHPSERYLEVVHRPESETPLKNKQRGERLVALPGQMCDLLTDWIENKRPDTVDEFGREPLLATEQGRIHVGTIQHYAYLFTRPCLYSGVCPHGRDIETCEATERDRASKCPSSVSPHAIRRGSITHALNQEMPEKAVSDRANVSKDVLEQHYDRRSEREKMEQRRRFIEML